MKKLNLGCGEFKKEGFVNLDWLESVRPDVLHDLNVFPYPFSDNTFDYIEADHVLEHLSSPFGVMRELHRITANGGKIVIRSPHFSRGITHPEHMRGFDVTFPYYFRKDFKGGYMRVELEIEKIKFSWFAQKYLKKQTLSPSIYLAASIGGAVLSFFANLSPILCGRVWCFWVGGFEEIEFIFVVKK